MLSTGVANTVENVMDKVADRHEREKWDKVYIIDVVRFIRLYSIAVIHIIIIPLIPSI